MIGRRCIELYSQSYIADGENCKRAKESVIRLLKTDSSLNVVDYGRLVLFEEGDLSYTLSLKGDLSVYDVRGGVSVNGVRGGLIRNTERIKAIISKVEGVYGVYCDGFKLEVR